MALKIFWTQLAEEKLYDIFEYYKEVAGGKIASDLVEGIENQTKQLIKNPEIGAIEEILRNRPQQFRFLIYKNYKVIYWIDNNANAAFIATVFDTRQNPTKIHDL